MIDRCYNGFADVEEWLVGFPDQKIGLSGPVTEDGEPYREFFAFGIARPGDEKLVERTVAANVLQDLRGYFEDRKGQIIWRVPFESETVPIGIVVEYRDDGPDFDPVADRRCTMDYNWLAVKCYCRLFKKA